MALERAKNQIIYAIHAIMEEYDVEDVDFILSSNKPKFRDECSYEIFTIYKPDLEDMSIELSLLPSYMFAIKHKTYKAEDFKRLKTAENLFKFVYDKLVETYEIADDAYYLKDYLTALKHYTKMAESVVTE